MCLIRADFVAAIFGKVQNTSSNIEHYVIATYKPCICRFTVVKEIANL